MFQNRISSYDMSFDNEQGRHAGAQAGHDNRTAPLFLLPVQAADIYQAAFNRAREDYELDKLFNPDFHDYQI